MNNLHRIVKNTRTSEQIIITKPIDNELLLYDNSVLISETNLEGIIT